MTALTFRHGIVAGAAAAGLVWSASAWAQAQADETRRRAQEELARALGGKVFTGADIGFQSKGVDRDGPVVVPVVKVDGAWVEVQLGVPGIRRLTK
jgi:hypothetical protein